MSRKLWIASLTVATLSVWGALHAAAASSRNTTAHVVQGYLGVELRDPSSKELSEQHAGVAHATEIVRVDHDGPAGKAGLREHDLILQLNGQAVGNQSQLRHLLHDTAPGQQVSMLILRDGQTMTVTAQVADRGEVERRAWEQHILAPQPEAVAPPDAVIGVEQGFLPAAPVVDAPVRQRHGLLSTVLGGTYTGLSLEAVTPQLGEFFGAESGAGLLVRSVDANSPAMVSGLRAGDVVLKVNQITMTSEAEWAKQMHESKGQPTTLLILRDRHEQTLTITPEAKHKAMLVRPSGPFSADGDLVREVLTAVVCPLS